MNPLSSRKLSTISLDGAPSALCSSEINVEFFISHLRSDLMTFKKMTFKKEWKQRIVSGQIAAVKSQQQLKRAERLVWANAIAPEIDGPHPSELKVCQ
jgi:hypothetical protein